MPPEAGSSSQWYTDVRPYSHYIQVSSLMTFFSDAAEMRAPSLYYSHGVNLSDLLRYCLALVNGHDLRFDQFRNAVLVQGEDMGQSPLNLLAKSCNGRNHSTPLILIQDCYEGVVLTLFFYLLLNYLSPNPEDQK